MKISELQAVCKYDDSEMDEVKNCHPKQIASEVIKEGMLKSSFYKR